MAAFIHDLLGELARVELLVIDDGNPGEAALAPLAHFFAGLEREERVAVEVPRLFQPDGHDLVEGHDEHSTASSRNDLPRILEADQRLSVPALAPDSEALRLQGELGEIDLILEEPRKHGKAERGRERSLHSQQGGEAGRRGYRIALGLRDVGDLRLRECLALQEEPICCEVEAIESDAHPIPFELQSILEREFARNSRKAHSPPSLVSLGATLRAT